jgi:hypothetical protein
MQFGSCAEHEPYEAMWELVARVIDAYGVRRTAQVVALEMGLIDRLVAEGCECDE